MTSIIARNAYRPGVADARVTALLARKPLRVATVAMANHTARAIWAIMTRGETYRVPAPPEAVAA
jgi:transposase